MARSNLAGISPNIIIPSNAWRTNYCLVPSIGIEDACHKQMWVIVDDDIDLLLSNERTDKLTETPPDHALLTQLRSQQSPSGDISHVVRN